MKVDINASTTRIGNGIRNDAKRTASVKEKTNWVKKVGFCSNSDCKHCKWGQLQGRKIVCTALNIDTLMKASCNQFYPGRLRIYQEQTA